MRIAECSLSPAGGACPDFSGGSTSKQNTLQIRGGKKLRKENKSYS